MSAAARASAPADALTAHLAAQLGAWPPAGPLVITTSGARRRPAWDGVVRKFAGVRTPEGAVLSVPQELLDAVRRVTAGAR
ncbi:MAG TPA: hypothetical protein VNU01_13470, partial [Egibacteraceae bacterium]|nr:hypothetical protein [Egibacteraceae bacterium]